jgi:hypothetical protein
MNSLAIKLAALFSCDCKANRYNLYGRNMVATVLNIVLNQLF